MTQPYSQQTQKILKDALTALGEREEMDPDFLKELRAMAGNGTLGSRSRVQKAVANLEARADELYD